MKKILFIGYGEPDPCSRYRIQQYYDKLRQQKNSNFILDYFKIYPSNSNITIPPTALNYPSILFRKFYSLYKCISFDVIFLQRNPVNVTSPYYERFIKYILRKKIIFDFDDALWCMYGGYDPRIKEIIKISDLVIVGNKYLAAYALKYNPRVSILNTIIDVDSHKITNKKTERKHIDICWIGSKPGNHYLSVFEDIFIKIKNKYKNKINISIVSNEKPAFKKFNEYDYVTWSIEKEKDILKRSDIGLMPLIDNEFTRGKCGFKLIQYGAYGMASIASPVGINQEIIKNGLNGFLANKANDWVSSISYLIDHKPVLAKMKLKSRAIVAKNYSLKTNMEKFVTLINSV